MTDSSASSSVTPVQDRLPIPWYERPLVTYALLSAIVGIYIITYIIDQTGDPQAVNPIYQYGILDYSLVTQYGQWYRLLSAMFVHLSPAHILFNGYALWIFGKEVERLFGHVHFAIIYFLGGLCGSLASLYLTRADSAGASGAIFAIFAAEIVYVAYYRKMLGKVGSAALRQLLILVVINFGLDIAANSVPGGTPIDTWGHVGGLLGGLILAYLLIGSARPPRQVPSAA